MKQNQQAALTVAGSDPSGGAGIQADIKTFTALGIYCSAAITSLTVQNTLGVQRVAPLEPELVREQIACVLHDLAISHVKIGMLGSSAVAASVCDALSEFGGEIICDPVLVSSSGKELIDRKGYTVIRERMFGLCSVLTPNIPELSLLTGKNCSSRESIQDAAETLLQQYKNLRSVIVTGGHFRPAGKSVTDYLLTRAAKHEITQEEITHPLINSRNTHGTGCTFSAAFTAFHLLSGNDREAFKRATSYMADIIRKSAPFTLGHGTGPLLHHLK